MKFIIALAFVAVVSALPPPHGFHHRLSEDHQVDGPSYRQDRYHQIDLIKLVYQKLIDRLSHPAQNDNEEEERAILNIVDTINVIGHILHDDSDDNNGFNGPSKPQHSEHDGQGDVPNKPPSSNNEISPKMQDEEEIIPSHVDIEDEVISVDEEIPASDESESDELSLVDEDDDRKHDVLSLVNEKDDEENPLIANKSVGVVN